MTFPPSAGRLLAAVVLLAGAVLVPASAAAAAMLPAPTGPVILTVTGAISETNAPGRADFDRAMLEGLGLVTLRTWTPWTDGVIEAEGVLAARLLAVVGASGTTAVARAVNDYVAEIPLADFERFPVIVAMTVDGRQLQLRDKGPLWIVYPWTDHPELFSLRVRHRSVWQLKQLEVR